MRINMKLIIAITAVLSLATLNIDSDAAVPNKSGVSADAISLPSGPGSIEGLGESFEPNLSTGSSRHSIPLSLPPGRNGTAPALALTYDSGAGNGVLGAGWQLTSMHIRRQSDKGLPEYGLGLDEDTYVTESGAELVRVSGGPEDSIQTFRLKNEGQFSRYVLYADDNRWQVTGRDGTVYAMGLRLDGTDVDGRVMHPDIDEAYAWYLTEIVDLNGNQVLYSYSKDQNQVYCDEIRYGFLSEGSPAHVVTFEYGDERPDPVVDYRPTFRLVTAKRLSGIDVSSSDIPVRSYSMEYLADRPMSLLSKVTYLGSDGESTLPPSEFTYSSQSIQATPDLISLPGLLGARLLLENESPDDVPESAELMDFDGNGLPDLYRSKDISVPDDKDELFMNMGAGTFVMEEIEPGASLGFQIQASRSFVRDVDGDGDCDVIAQRSADPEDLAIKLNGGGSWESGDIPITLPNGLQVANVFSGEDVRALDLNFDRKVDSIRSQVLTSGSNIGFVLSTYLNNGDGTISRVPETSTDVIRGAPLQNFSEANGQLVMADINGDRLADLVYIRDQASGGPRYWPSMGMGKFDDSTFGYSLSLTDGPNYGGNTGLVSRLELGDLNGDGLADLYHVIGSTVRYWLNEGGSQFGERQTIFFGKVFDNNVSTYRLLDLDGDGLKEILFYTQFSPSSDDLPAGMTYIRLFADNRAKLEDSVDNDGDGLVDEADEGNSVPNLLSTISNGIGQLTSIGYTPSVLEMQRDNAAGTYWSSPPPFSVPVVTKVDVFDGLRTYQKQFAYHDGFYDGEESEFRGFGKVDQFEVGDASAPTLFTELTFDTGQLEEARKGLLLGVTAKTLSGEVFFDETTEWNTRELATGATGEARSVVYPFKVDTTRSIFEKGEGTPVSVMWEYEFDDYGNRTSLLEHGRVDGSWDDERLTVSVYSSNYPANVIQWILNKPVTTEISDENEARVSASRYFYDENLSLGVIGSGNVTKQESWVENQRWLIDFTGVYDDFGNMTERRDGEYEDGSGHKRIYTFDSVHKIYPVKEEIDTGELLLTLGAGYDYGLGLITHSDDTNSHRTSYTYDVFGRLKSVVRPGDTLLNPTEWYDYQLARGIGGDRMINWVETRLREVAGGGSVDKRTFYDGRGQAVVTRAEGETPGQIVVTDGLQFNARGIPSRQVLSYFDTGTLAYADPDLTKPSRVLQYDALLRLVRTDQPDGTHSVIVREPLKQVHRDEEQTLATSVHSGSEKRIVFDGLGPADSGGRVREIREIVKIGPMGQPLTVPAEWMTTYRFTLQDKIAGYTDAQNNQKTLRYDGVERLVFVDDPDRGVMTYNYDDASNLTSTVDAKGQTNRYEYDGANRLRKEFHSNSSDVPDVEYHYDTVFGPVNRGEFWSSTGPAAIQRVVLGIDAPNPDFDLNVDGQIDVADVVAASQSPNTIEAQNTLGFLSWVRDGSGEEHNSYDNRGRNEWTIRRIEDQNGTLKNFYMGRTFDSMNRVRSLVYPDQSSITYAYNDRGLLKSIPGVVADMVYNPVASALSFTLGGGLSSSYTYDSRFRLKTISSSRSSDNLKLQDFTYNYDNVSNVTGIIDGRSDAQLTSIGAELGLAAGEALQYDANQSFIYDSLYRLTQAKNEDVYGTVDYRYDRIGNKISQTADLLNDQPAMNLGTVSFGGNGGSSGRIGRAPGDPAGPHAVTQSQSGGFAEFIYDDNGNRVSEGSTTYGWDSKDRLTQITDSNGQATYNYDYTGSRKSKVVSDAEGQSTQEVLYVNGLTEVRNGQLYKYVYANGNRVARARHGTDFAPEKFFLHDHLGSAHVTLTNTFSVSDHVVSYPYGTAREQASFANSARPVDYTFTGKEFDTESDWFYYEARYMQPAFGSFTSVDPLDQLLGGAGGSDISFDPQSLNRYAYVQNNPLRYKDPDGRAAQAAGGVIVGGGIGFAYGLFGGIVGEFMRDDPALSWSAAGRVLKSALKNGAVGAVSGGVLVTAGPAASLQAGVATAAFLGGVDGAATRALDGGTPMQVVASGVVGATIEGTSVYIGGVATSRMIGAVTHQAASESVSLLSGIALNSLVSNVPGAVSAIGDSMVEVGEEISASFPDSIEEMIEVFSQTPSGPNPE